MARSFRFYGKKRGNRRTGSSALGGLGEALFWAVFLLLGCGGMVLMFSNFVVPEWRVNHEFVETTCKVLKKQIGEKANKDGLLYRPEITIEYNNISTRTYYDIHDTYSSSRQNAQAVLDRFEVDNQYRCWYDPSDPFVAVLTRGYRWWIWPAFTVPVSFVLIGAGGLIYTLLHWGKSAERRAAMQQYATERDFFRGAGERGHPCVPQGVDMTNSPGTKFKFRLPMATSPGWALFGTLALCLIVNGVVGVLTAMAIRNHIAGQPDWFLTIFIIPFVALGLALIVIFIRRLLVATGIGPTLLEISDHPLRPGGQYQVFLSQSGRLTAKAMRVWLACEEAATYRQGTNTRSETKEVYRHELFRREELEIESGLPFEAEFDLNVFPGAMHSFKADHNEINWALVVEGDVARWPNFKRSFPVIIHPASGSIER